MTAAVRSARRSGTCHQRSCPMVERVDKAALYARPLHPYTQVLIASVPTLSPVGRAERRAQRATRVSGNIASALAIPAGCRFHPRCPHAMPVCRLARR